ncbi:MAG: NAD(P)H-binding protein [Desulfobacteraceae bacterium]|jgi:NADH dehydrogenase
MDKKTHAVTGAFGYSGKYIAKKLIDDGHKVITITNSLDRKNPFSDKIEVYPFNFDAPAKLEETFQGVSVLYNTYWVRFNHKTFTHADAVRNSEIMFTAAKKAGVKRIVHISITNPSLDSPLEYFSGKARLEKSLIDSGISYAILRPTVLFGKEDILINNIAWGLRYFPVFGVFGDGQYKMQPIYVEDLADLAIQYGRERNNLVVDAIGPETFTYRELVKRIGEIIHKRRPIISVPPGIAYLAGWIIGKAVNDVMITKEEIEGLMSNLLYVESPPAGSTKLSEWANKHSDTLGLKYTSELARRVDRKSAYKSN